MPTPKLYHRTPSRGASLADLHELAILWAEEEFERAGNIPFMWLLDTGKTILWVETPWENDSEKLASMMIISIICRELNVTGYSVAIEAWVAVETAPPGTTLDDVRKKSFRKPSDRPKNERDDVMVISTIGRDGEQMASRYLVTPRRHGKNLLGPRVDEWEAGVSAFSGNLFEIFRPHCPLCKTLIGHKEKCPAHVIAHVFTKGEAL
jgi:hypothetical protein